MAVYGHGEFRPPFDECFKPMPIDPYGVAKYACEMDLKIAGEQHGLD
jgi:UDP-glucose 4-epimerase